MNMPTIIRPARESSANVPSAITTARQIARGARSQPKLQTAGAPT